MDVSQLQYCRTPKHLMNLIHESILIYHIIHNKSTIFYK
nr:MAG TPA: hypothetical protein [Caudoviricetes sp.]